MIALFLKAETDIINEIGRLRSLGLADYHAVAALKRVQAILRKLEDDCWTYAPQMIERQFYVNHPEVRKPLDVPETPEKHLRGYQNAFALTSTQMDIVQRLTMNLMGLVSEASQTTSRNLEDMLIGRTENDPFRRIGLSQAAAMQAAGQGAWRPVPGFVEALRRDGITAFVDKAGRNWNLHTYGSMVLRTTSRQAEVLAVLTQDPEQDLYQISAHGSTCKLCASLEGRVYSKSGRDPDFPPLAAAFGKMDKAGPDTLENSWLNIHPNCLHQLLAWTPMGRSEEEIRKIKEFSSFQRNPVTRDPRTQKQGEAYRQKERDRARWLREQKKKEQTSAESDIIDNTRRTAKGIKAQQKVVGYHKLPQDMQRNFRRQIVNAAPDVKKLLRHEYRNTDYIVEEGGQHSFYSRGFWKNIIHISKDAPPSTLAHELFHKIDKNHKISKTFTRSLSKDHAELMTVSGGAIKEYLMKRYPEAFEISTLTGMWRLKEEYRGISDILNGLSGGKIYYGAGHMESYWKESGRLEAEAWAQFGRIQFENNEVVIKFFQEIFPNFSRCAMIALKGAI